MAGVLTDAAGPLSGGSSETGVLTASEFGLVSSASVDQTALFQAFINDTTAKLKVIDVQIIKYTSAMTLPAGGTRLMGYGSGGDFATYLVPTDCAAFNFSGVHHSLLENFMIWPQGTTPPANIITVTNGCYNLTLREIRLHVASTYVPSVTVIDLVKGSEISQGIFFDKVIVRSDGTNFPLGYQFGADCGQSTLTGCDLETCTVGMKHLGGKITVISPYTERIAATGVSLEPSTDANASFTMIGGLLGVDASAAPIAIRAGAKNVSIQGTWMTPAASGYQGYIYSTSGCSNINISPANFDATKWASEYFPTPSTILTLGRGLNALPATKFTTINATTGTLAAGNITGAAFVSLMSTNATPGNQATRTAAQMITDHGMGPVDAAYTLRITNTGAGTFTLTAGSNVTLTGTMTVATNTFRDFTVTFRGAATQTVTIQSIGVGTYS